LLFYSAYAIVFEKGIKTNMSEQNELLTSNGHQIEKSTVTDTPVEVLLPVGDERLVIGATQYTESEQGHTGLEVVSLAGYPRNERGEIDYNGTLLNSKLEAILVDPTVAPDFEAGSGFKGLRKNEVISSETLTKRFGKEAGFNLGLDESGSVMIENVDPQKSLDILSIKPIETAVEDQAVESARKLLALESETNEVSTDAPEIEETSEELHEEAAEDMGEKATEQVIDEPERLEPSLDQILGEVKAHYKQKTGMLMDDATQDAYRLLGGIEDAVQQVDGSIRELSYLSVEASNLTRLIANIEMSNYNNDMVRGTLSKMLNGLHSMYARVNQASQYGVVEISQPALQLDTTFEQAKSNIGANDASFISVIEEQKQRFQDQEPTVVPEVTTSDFLAKVQNAQKTMGGLVSAPTSIQGELNATAEQLRTQLEYLDNMMQHHDIQASDLQPVVVAFNQIAENSNALLLGPKLQETIDTLRRSFSPSGGNLPL
jgi:hypothetical protein